MHTYSVSFMATATTQLHVHIHIYSVYLLTHNTYVLSFIHGNTYNATVNFFVNVYLLIIADQTIVRLSSNVGRVVGQARRARGKEDVISMDTQSYSLQD